MEKPNHRKIKTAVLSTVMLISASVFLSTVAEARLATCGSSYKKYYLKGPTHKAMVTTGGRSPFTRVATSCGVAWGYPTRKRAISEAIRQCRITDRKFRDPGVCQVFRAQ